MNTEGWVIVALATLVVFIIGSWPRRNEEKEVEIDEDRIQKAEDADSGN